MDINLNQLISGRASAKSDPNLEVEVTKECLVVKYPCKTWRTMYDISDMNGRILKTGELNNENPETKISIEGMKASNYTLWIVDGADLIKYNFRISDQE